MRSLSLPAALGLLVAAAAPSPDAAAFGLSFEWGDIGACVERRSPEFRVFSPPRGTARLVFEMVNLDAPDAIHGGGTVPYTGEGTVRRGAFLYRGPCPPRGQRQRYRWTVTAEDGAGQTLGSASAISFFPLDPNAPGAWRPMQLVPPTR